MLQRHAYNLDIPDNPVINESEHPNTYRDLMYLRLALNSTRDAVERITGAVPVDATVAGAQSMANKVSCVYAIANVAINAGQLVGLINSAGVLKAVLATATTPVYARAFAVTSAAVGKPIQLQFEGNYTFSSALTPASLYYLSNTAGGVSATPGTYSQVVGVAVSSNILIFRPTLL